MFDVVQNNTDNAVPSLDLDTTLDSLVVPITGSESHGLGDSANHKRSYAMRELAPGITHLIEWVRDVAAVKPRAISESSLLDLTHTEIEVAQGYLRGAWNEVDSTSPQFAVYALDAAVRLGSIGLPLVHRILDRYNDSIDGLLPAQRCRAVYALAQGRFPHHDFFETVVQDAILHPHHYDLKQLNRILGSSTEVNFVFPDLATIVAEQALHTHKNVKMEANLGPLLLRVACTLEIAGHEAAQHLLDAAMHRLEAGSRTENITSGLASRIAQLCRVNGRLCPAWVLSKVPIFVTGENRALRPFQVEIQQELRRAGIAHEVGVLCVGIPMDYFLPPQAGLKKGVALQADMTHVRYVSRTGEDSSTLVASERYIERLRRSFGIETLRIRSDKWLEAKHRGTHTTLLESRIFGELS